MQKILRYIFLLAVCFLVLHKAVVSQIENIRFEKISIEEGLSQNSITSIFQDSYGYMWFGTLDGLNRYNGYEMKIFRNSINNPNSIADNYINVIFEDSKKRLWIGTRSNGLSLFDRLHNRFTTYKYNPDDQHSLCNNNVLSITEGPGNMLWLGTANGLCRFNPENGKSKAFFHDTLNANSISANIINKVENDENNNLWIATDYGLNRYNYKENKFYRYKLPVNENNDNIRTITTFFKDKRGILWYGTNFGLFRLDFDENENIARFLCGENNTHDCNQITAITQDNTGILWIGTELSGLIKFDPVTGKTTRYIKNSNDPFSLSSNKITSIYFDCTNILWIGTNLDGLNKWDKANEGIELYRINPYNKNTLSSNKIRAIFEDHTGNIWLGTVDGGLNKWNQKTGDFKHFLDASYAKTAPGNIHVRTIFEDNAGFIWAGTEKNGLYILNPFTGDIENITYDENLPNGLPGNSVWSIIQDSENKLWIGTYDGGIGLVEERIHNNLKFRIFRNSDEKNSLTDNRVTTIFEDSGKQLWIGTFGGGLNRFNKKDSSFSSYMYNPNDTNSLGSNRVYSIMEDKNGILWIGTKGSLNRFNTKNETFTRYTEANGLPNNVIMGILEDKKGNLWLSTNKGISKFDKDSNIYINYDIKKGLQSNEFLVGSYCKSSHGKLYFGGVNGFNAFYPDSVKQNQIPPKVIISNFKLSNVDINPDDESGILSKHISQTQQIMLDYDQNSFSFEFVALHYSQPLNNRYKYMLVNQEKNWVDVNANQRIATYTNLKPGKYIFKVKAANSDGVWSDEVTSTVIIITPPFWGTWWFRILFVLFVIGSAYAWYRSRINRIERQKKILEQQVKERTAEVEAQKIEIMKQAEQLEKLSIVASETDNAVMITDSKGNFEWINEAFTRMFEYSFDQLVGEVSNNIVGPKTLPEIRKKIQEVIKNKRTMTYELQAETRSGRKIWVQTTLTPILNENREITKLVAIDSDINDIKQAENEIKEQNIKIQRQNEKIKGSIRYAQTIQKAILPLEKRIQSYFESFVLYLPKDIVSGDFYWFSSIKNKQTTIKAINDEGMKTDTIVFIAVADCTGHGVPGAFMSMIGNRLLNEIVNENKILTPSKILFSLDEKVKMALKQEQTDNNDGMDVCLCRIENKNSKMLLTFCGAKRPLFHYCKQQKELNTIRGDRKTIGGVRTRRSDVFTDTEIEVEKGDIIYLTSDGLIDQPGPERKRFGTKRFLHVLNQNIDKSMQQQKEILLTELANYQQQEEQRDDITVLGIKFL